MKEKDFEAISSQLIQSAIPTFERKVSDLIDEIKKMVVTKVENEGQWDLFSIF